ncbi:hypothetical protein NIB75_11255 [Bacteroides uniformis]|nr:hypothetical protein [Bacteroides uniformis]
MVDEFPTILLQGIDTFIGTARKHNVATILAVRGLQPSGRGGLWREKCQHPRKPPAERRLTV